MLWLRAFRSIMDSLTELSRPYSFSICSSYSLKSSQIYNSKPFVLIYSYIIIFVMNFHTMKCTDLEYIGW